MFVVVGMNNGTTVKSDNIYDEEIREYLATGEAFMAGYLAKEYPDNITHPKSVEDFIEATKELAKLTVSSDEVDNFSVHVNGAVRIIRASSIDWIEVHE